MVIVFGSLNNDFFLNVERFPLPGETVLTSSSFVKPGGKGANQAVAASCAGADTVFVGAAGNDELAQVSLSALKKAGVDVSYVQRSDKSTGMAMIVVDSSAENSIVVASGANGDLSADKVPDALLEKGGVLVMQMETPVSENIKLMRRAKEKGMKCLLNVAPAKELPPETAELADVLIVNEIEALSVYGSFFGKEARDARFAARALSEKTGGICVLTLGGKGALLANGGEVLEASALNIRPVDTTGAGDAFVGTFAANLEAGCDIADILKRSCAAAGLACLKAGAQEALPPRDEILRRAAEIRLS